MDLIDKVKNILLEELNLDAIENVASQQDYPEWDSLTYLRVMSALEREFGIDITPQNINNFNSIPHIIKEIEAIV